MRFIVREDGIFEGCRLTLNVESAAVARFVAGKFGRSNVNLACTAHKNSTTVTGLAFPNHVVREGAVGNRQSRRIVSLDSTAGNLRRITVENRLVNGNRGVTYTKGTTTLFGAVAGEGAASDGASRLVTDLVDTTVSINLIAGMNGVLNLEICHTGNKTNTTAGGSVVVSERHTVNQNVQIIPYRAVGAVRRSLCLKNRAAFTLLCVVVSSNRQLLNIKTRDRSANDAEEIRLLFLSSHRRLRFIRNRHAFDLSFCAVAEIVKNDCFRRRRTHLQCSMGCFRCATRRSHRHIGRNQLTIAGGRSHRTAGEHCSRCCSNHRLCALGLNGRSRFIDDHQRRTRLGEDDLKRLVHLTKLRKFSFFCTALCVPRAPPPFEAVHPQNKNFCACLLGGGIPLYFSAVLSEIFGFCCFSATIRMIFTSDFRKKELLRVLRTRGNRSSL